MSSIQEISEELVNLTVKEVNELLMIIKGQEYRGIQKYKIPNNIPKNYNSSPKIYEQSLKSKNNRKKNYAN